MSGKNYNLHNIITAGWFTEDPECTYVGSEEERSRERRYFIQLSGSMHAKQFWTDVTTLSVQKYLRDELKDYPDAMILKTKFL